MTIKQFPRLALTVTSILLVVSIPQQVQALSLTCCASLDDMEQSSDLIIRGRALSEVEDVEEIHFSEAEYQAHLASGETLPLGISVVVHDEKWQFVTGYTALPVEVLTVIEGETNKQVISVAQQNDWGATHMVKNAEYLLFLNRSLYFESGQAIYYDFYGQGKYNTDRTDLAAGSAGYYDVEEVKQRYGDRVDFLSTLPTETVNLSQPEEAVTETTWFRRLLGRFRRWLAVG